MLPQAQVSVTGNHLVTQSLGVKFKTSGHSEHGVAYEFPLSNFQDIIDDRLQVCVDPWQRVSSLSFRVFRGCYADLRDA